MAERRRPECLQSQEAPQKNHGWCDHISPGLHVYGLTAAAKARRPRDARYGTETPSARSAQRKLGRVFKNTICLAVTPDDKLCRNHGEETRGGADHQAKPADHSV